MKRKSQIFAVLLGAFVMSVCALPCMTAWSLPSGSAVEDDDDEVLECFSAIWGYTCSRHAHVVLESYDDADEVFECFYAPNGHRHPGHDHGVLTKRGSKSGRCRSCRWWRKVSYLLIQKEEFFIKHDV